MEQKRRPKEDLENIQVILDRLAHKESTEEEAEHSLEKIWNDAYMQASQQAFEDSKQA